MFENLSYIRLLFFPFSSCADFCFVSVFSGLLCPFILSYSFSCLWPCLSRYDVQKEESRMAFIGWLGSARAGKIFIGHRIMGRISNKKWCLCLSRLIGIYLMRPSGLPSDMRSTLYLISHPGYLGLRVIKVYEVESSRTSVVSPGSVALRGGNFGVGLESEQ